jgi:hypothetical protein
MVIKINPNQQALWLDPKRMQLGLGKDRVQLGALSPAQEQLIATLYRGIANQQLPVIAKQLGLAEAETDRILEQVGPLLLREREVSERELSAEFVAAAFAEIIGASLMHSADGQAVLLERAQRSIHVEDLSKPGLAVSLGLAAAGIGHLLTHDLELVSSKDLGPTGYPSQLGGQARIEALRALLAASPNQTLVSNAHRIAERNIEAIDCAVLIGQQVIAPKRYARWLNRDVPHIAIVFDTEGVWVSPVIVPGKSPCLFCLERLRTDEDPNWPVLASQLTTSKTRMDDAGSQLFAAGLAVQKVLAQVDAIAGFDWNEVQRIGYRLDRASGQITELKWPEHAECGCRLTSGQELSEES